MRRMRAFVQQASGTVAPLGTLAFWIGMGLAARSYPSEYDWRYMTMSSLVYAERNPSGFLWARGGLFLCGVAGLYWTAELLRGWRRLYIAQRPIGIWVLGLGYLCMTCCAVLPEGRFITPRAHDLLALAAFVGICVGLAVLTFKVIARSPYGRKLRGSPRLYAGMLAGFALSPIVLGAVAQAYVSHELPALPWVSLVWRKHGVPVYLSFAFWEWVTCAVFSPYVAVLSRASPPSGRCSSDF
jgi:hypothetical protein